MKIRGNTIGTPIKPEKNLVKATNLTPEEQAQARANIGAASAEDLGDIETALDTIIAIQEELINNGGGSSFDNPITFYYSGAGYTANDGMTWQELIDSPNCPTIWQECCGVENKLFLHGVDDGYQVYTDNCCGPPYALIDSDGAYVYTWDTIMAGAYYYDE